MINEINNLKSVYLYLLIEFQSTVDRFLSFRMLQYIMELYRELIYKHKCKRLPVVFPILIYNGDKKWTAPVSLQELIEVPPVLKQCKPYIPHFQYYPIIENAIDKKGIQKGIQKGMKDGLLQGVTQERITIARNLLKHGMDDRTILRITKLKKSQLDEIKKNI